MEDKRFSLWTFGASSGLGWRLGAWSPLQPQGDWISETDETIGVRRQVHVVPARPQDVVADERRCSNGDDGAECCRPGDRSLHGPECAQSDQPASYSFPGERPGTFHVAFGIEPSLKAARDIERCKHGFNRFGLAVGESNPVEPERQLGGAMQVARISNPGDPAVEERSRREGNPPVGVQGLAEPRLDEGANVADQ